MVPEMISRDAYGAINGALVAPMNPGGRSACGRWSATGGYNAVLVRDRDRRDRPMRRLLDRGGAQPPAVS